MNIKKSWEELFNNYNSINYDSINKNTLNNILKKIYENNQSIYPKYSDILKSFTYFEIIETKVVILGQDPYYRPNQAIGLSFGINIDNIAKIPPSLKNISKELKNDLNVELADYSLEKWAKQGILLLNASLSVIENKPTSHMSLWNDFTSFIINELNNCNHQIIFVAWGAFAHNKLANIDTNKHKIIISSHPSPLSVNKHYKQYPPFNNSKVFSKINQYLIENNQMIIDW